MKNSSVSEDCQLPFLYDETEGLCETTVYEYYLPVSYYLSISFAIFGVLVFLGLCYTLKRLLSKKALSLNNWKDRFFRYKFITLFLLIAGTFSCVVHILSGSLIKYSIETRKGKINALSSVYLALFNYIGTFSFLPVLINLLGLEQNEKSLRLVKNCCFNLVALNNIPFFILIHYIVLESYVSTKQFIVIVLAQSAINAVILAFLCIFVINKLIRNIQFLKKSSIKHNRPKSHRNKLHTFLTKLKISRVAATFHFIVSTLIILPFVVDIFQNDALLFFITFIFVGSIPLSVAPLLFHYSAYILPGSDQCFSVDSPATSLSTQV
eukprot:snap_masked-scaffold_16-processed-gene-6.55-mRNA-1 protein AED:1.00 eAED:1.00 QI:0/-1/0/0/-1/1/1/0/322